MLRATLLAALLAILPGWACAGGSAPPRDAAEVLPQITARVVQVYAGGGGAMNAASAVLLGEGLAVTNCHVVDGAAAVAAVLGVEPSPAPVVARDTYHDLCLLRVGGGQAVAAPRRASASVAAGEPSYAVGFARGRLGFSRGPVTMRYAMDGGHVLRTAAGFLAGASGGGLFDAQGRLIGILTFYRRNPGGSMYLALPMEWVDRLIARAGEPDAAKPADADIRQPFWDIDPRHADPQRPRFIEALVLEAAGRWDELAGFASRWLATAPDDEAAQATLALARRRGRTGDAAPASR